VGEVNKHIYTPTIASPAQRLSAESQTSGAHYHAGLIEIII